MSPYVCARPSTQIFKKHRRSGSRCLTVGVVCSRRRHPVLMGGVRGVGRDGSPIWNDDQKIGAQCQLLGASWRSNSRFKQSNPQGPDAARRFPATAAGGP